MTPWTNRTIIVPNDRVEFARILTGTIAGSPGEGMWTTPLSPTGELPITHWISAGLISQEFASILPFDTYVDDVLERTPGQPEACAYLANQGGMTATVEDVNNLFTESSVTEEEPLSAMNRLGLQIVSVNDL